MFNTHTRVAHCRFSRCDNPPPASVLYSGFSSQTQTELVLGEWQRYSQLGEPRQLEGSDGDLADAVPTQPQDLQGGTQVVQRSQLQHADFVVAQVPE